MSLLGQINLHSVNRFKSIGYAPNYVKGLTYDRLHQQFERPANALGNRYRNPLERAYDKVAGAYKAVAGTLRGFAFLLRRIEISVSLRPQ